MKKFFYITFFSGLFIISTQTFASSPTDINYHSKGKTFAGKKYVIYTVRCSDGKKRKITAWNKRKKWCVGKASNRNCSNSQMKAAKKACKN
jgi:hypothetical protein